MMRRVLWTWTIALAVGGFQAAPARAQEPTLQERAIARAQEVRKSAAAKLGVSVVDLRSGRTVLDIDANAPLIPASNQKLLTSAFAMERLGRDFRFTTAVCSLGDDLVVTGDGDPTLGDPILAAAEGKTIYDCLDSWAMEVRQKLGSRIPGDLVLALPASWSSYRHKDWPKGQWSQWYAAPVAALNFHNNCFDVTFTPADGKAVPRVQPQSRLIQVASRVKIGRKHAWSGKLSKDDATLTLTGTVTRGGNEPVSLAVNDPPMLLGRVLVERLARAGVELGGTIRVADAASVDLGKARRIAETTTPLAVVLSRANKRSLNMAAECVFLRAGDGTWEGSAALLARTLAERYGLDMGTVTVRDGGGLSRGNQVAPATITALLSAVLRRPDAGTMLDSLPISGVDGTMEHRLAEPPYRTRVLGKTGYIAGVSTLSGYVLDASGKPAIAFSILANGVSSGGPVREFQDTLCRELVDSLSAPTESPAPK